jgi:hypothetical protein
MRSIVLFLKTGNKKAFYLGEKLDDLVGVLIHHVEALLVHRCAANHHHSYSTSKVLFHEGNTDEL